MAGLCTLNSAHSRRIEPTMCSLLRLTPLSNVRALIVAGEADTVVSPLISHILHAALPSVDKRLLLLPDGTHDLFAQRVHLRQQVAHFICEGLQPLPGS